MRGERRTLDPEALSSPERWANAQQRARLAAWNKAHGLCASCKNRERTLSIYHCRNMEERQRGACLIDQREPRYTFDPETLRVLARGKA